MKKFSKILSVTLIAAIMVTSIAACSKEDKKSSKDKKPEVKTETKKEEPSETISEETDAPVVDVEETIPEKNSAFRSGIDIASATILSDEDVENESNYIMIGLSDSDFAANVKFSFSEEIEDFQFVEIDATVDDEGELVINKVTPSYELGVVEDDMSIIITLDLPEILPTSGIVFTDEDGNAHLLVLLVSGEDGSPYFEEILALG